MLRISFIIICNLNCFVKPSLYRERGSTLKTFLNRFIKNGKEFLNPKNHLFDIKTKKLSLHISYRQGVKSFIYIAF